MDTIPEPTDTTEPPAPPIRDSDLMYLAIKRLEAVAAKMQRLEYDGLLDKMIEEAAELMNWAAYNIARRSQSGADDEAER